MTFERGNELDAGNAEPVILDPAVQLFAGREHDLARSLDNRRGLRLGVLRSAMYKTRRTRPRLWA